MTRLFGIPARDVPVVAVLRRGPSDWCHIGRWDVGPAPAYQPGAWLRARVYPQRCDVSPDGRYLCYFAMATRPTSWAAGQTYFAVSRLPWATALAAWGTDGTWTTGLRFADRGTWELAEPDAGDARPLRERWGLAVVRATSYPVERRTGWVEAPGSPPFDPGDPWELRRGPLLELRKSAPAGDGWLSVRGGYAATRALSPERLGPPRYQLCSAPSREPRALERVQWAEWSPDGQLLVATDEGRLQVRTPDGRRVVWEHDLAGAQPATAPPPREASTW